MFRTLRRSLRVTSGRAAVRSPLPWYLRGAALVFAVALAAALSWWTYSLGQEHRDAAAETAADQGVRESQEESAKLKLENIELRQQLAQAERQVDIERSTYGELAKQVKSLASENASLKEDLAFFQTVMPPPKADQPLSVNRFVIEKQLLPGEYGYRLLLLNMAPFAGEFAGSFQLVVELMQNGRREEVAFPGADARGSVEFRLRFKSYQRLEGLFKVPEDAQVRRVQIRVFEEGNKSPRLVQTIDVAQDGAANVHSKR
jgi:hypothetical protein